MNFDQYRVSGDRPARLALGRPAFFMVTESDDATFDPKRTKRVVLGECKSVTLQRSGAAMDFKFTGCTDDERKRIGCRLNYLFSTDDSLGLAIEREQRRSCLVAFLLHDEAAQDAEEAFSEIDAEEQADAYSVRDRATGEEIVMLDPPGGTFRDMADEYRPSEETGTRLRDRSDGYWVNGDCRAFRPQGDVRSALLNAVSLSPLILNVPPLKRTQVFPDGYEVIEVGSEAGWQIWQWCAEKARGSWGWVSLGADGGPWLELGDIGDTADLLLAHPELLDLNPNVKGELDGEGEA